ncbi:PPR: pentatricopeptide repeat domain containing protein [Nitzschia inconspicua]|uniref:PPR: pentatricopeptide repeat domain containing protein n=1 Tax=Nitzschia inconspicua TaxID=303405 RepID=A0A9K3L9M5_9STRA|nr:PPR: pentatricopeptide repeat domain containing protein [Nitzschia inconspicua]
MAQRQRWPLTTSLSKVVSLSKTLLLRNGKQCHWQIQHYRSRQQLQQQQQQQQYRTFVDFCYRKPVVHWRLSSLSQQQSTEHCCHVRSLYKCRRMTYSQHHFQKDDDEMGLESVDRASNSFSTTKSVTPTTISSKVSVASMEDKWQAMTKRLIGTTHNNNNNNHDTDNNDTIPYTVGSLTDAMWVEARQVLQYWMEQGNISLCWQILDRLNDELSMVIAPISTTRHQLPAVEILNPILKLWKEDLQYHFLNQLESSDEVLVEKPLWPSQVAERVRQYQKNRLVQPDKASHCIIMNATVHIQQHVPTTEGVEFVESYFRTWVRDWQESSTDKRHSFPEPDSHALGTVIRAWAESDHLDGPERAEAWLKEPFVHSLGILNNPGSAMILYTSIMTAWARIGNPFKANEWMDRIRDETRITDRRCWATLIRAWATYATLHNNNANALLGQPHHFVYPKEKEDRIMAGNHAHKLIEEMTEEIRPLTGTYNVILEMWSKLSESLFVEYNDEEASRQAADQANSLLLRMKNVPPESDSETSSPNPASYYAVLSAFCRSRQPWLAEKLLDTIVQETSNGGSDSALEIQYFSVVISGWSMIDDRLDVGERGDDLFQVAKKCGLVPDSALYCACINCWAKAAEKGNATLKRKAIRRSEALIVEMKEQGIPWNSFAFSELVKVYANCNELEKAQEFLDAWLSEYETTHDPELLPAPIIFTPLLSAWARSKRPHAAIHSLELLRKMQKYNVMPNDFSYAAVINAFGSSKVEDAADIALQLFYEMQTDAGIEPSVYSWSSVIAALAKHGRIR